MSTEDTDEDAAHEVDVEEPIEVGDLLDDPRTDVEALCLCALLWSATDTARQVSDLLRRTDFDRALYGELFDVITAQVRSGVSRDPASIAGVCARVAQRILAMTAAIWHNDQLGPTHRSLTAYDH